jgi:hypothetical protein
MRYEAMQTKDEKEEKFNKDVLRSVSKVEFRPYSRHSVDPSYNWEAGLEYHQIPCYVGDTTYKVSYSFLLLLYQFLATILESQCTSSSKR